MQLIKYCYQLTKMIKICTCWCYVNKMLVNLLKMKLRRLFLIFISFIGFLVIIYQIYYLFGKVSINDLPKIIWWTPFTLRDELEIISCGDFQCAATDNRKYYKNSETQAFLFYASNFKPYDLPLPRTKSHSWGILHEESPKNLALFLHNDALAEFNYSSTFSRHSDVPLTLQYLPSLELLTGLEYFVPTITKNTYLDKIAPVLYIQSDCQTPLERDSYVQELMKYVDVDSYGKCLNNQKLPEKFTKNPLENLYEHDFMHFVAKYKFVIAFENAVCDDYITEKLWRPLIVGSIPIYLGSPSVQDWLPNGEKSAILVEKFESPKQLGEYIKQVNKDNHMYNTYLQHKLSDLFKITNANLKSHFAQKKLVDNHFFSEFECRICENMHLKYRRSSLDRREYNCPEPVSPLTRRRNMTNWWIDHWAEGKCHAKLFRHIVSNNLNIHQKLYDETVKEMIRDKTC